MDCEQAIERLPWLLNATLPPEERRAVEAHVAECERCAQAFADTRAAWKVFAQHLPTADLVAYAADEPTGVARETLERHLAGCPQCAAELEMARASRALAEHGEVAVLSRPAAATAGSTRPGPRIWRSSALAASLIGLVAIGGWIHSTGEIHALEARLGRERPPAEAALRGGLAQASPAAPAAPGDGSGISTRPATVDLEPEGEATTVRGERATAGEAVPSGADYVLFSLHPSAQDTGRHRQVAAELEGPAGGPIEIGSVAQNPDGFYVLGVPRRLLSRGQNVIRLYAADGGRRTLVGTYAFQG